MTGENLGKLYKFCESLGPVTTLLSLPGALFAVFLFHAELWGYMTVADVSAELREVSVRCSYNYTKNKPDEKNSFSKICQEAPLAISFSYRLENEDSVTRYFAKIRAIVEVPEFGTLNYSFVYDIEHVVQNGWDAVEKRPWFVKSLSPAVTSTYEVELLPDPYEGNHNPKS
jgi:hypothetical protein